MTPLPDTRPPNENNGPASIVLTALRLALGYVVAVAAGAILFAILLPWTSGDRLGPSGVAEVAIICFVLGLLFAAPYTVIACLALKFLLPPSPVIFMIVGALCPGVTILMVQLIFGAVVWPAEETIKVLLITIPTGLLSTYLFGAVGLGRWRFA